MKHLKYLIITAWIIALIPTVVFAINVTVPQSTQYGQVLIGNQSGGNYTPVATSTLGITGTNFFTNVGDNTYLSTGIVLQAPSFQATSTTATSTFAGPVGVDGYFYTGPYLFDGSYPNFDGNFSPDNFIADFTKDEDDYVSVSMTNPNDGVNASIDLVWNNNLTADPDGDGEFNYYADIGFNSSNYNIPFYGLQNVPNMFYIYNKDGPMNFTTATSSVLGYIQFTTGGFDAEAMRITNTGRVGIGSTSPIARLVVTNPLSENAVVVEDEAFDATPFTIGPTGNVGIGNLFPANKLHVSDGNILNSALTTTDQIISSWQNTAPGFNIISASSNSPDHRGVFKGTRSRGTISSPTAVIAEDSTLSLLGAAYDGTATQATALMSFIVDGPVSTNVVPQRIGFITSQTTGGARTEKFTIKSTGNIGAGTTTPVSTFQVASTSPKLYISDTDAGLNLKHWFIQNNSGALRFATTSDALGETTTNALNISSAGVMTVGQPAAIAPQLIVQGGASGTSLIRLSRTIGTTATFDWTLGGGGLTFNSAVENNNVFGVYGDLGYRALYFGTRQETVANKIANLLSAVQFSTGTDIPGVAFEIIGSRGTGAGTPGDINFSTGVATVSGTALQATSTRLTIKGATGNIGVSSSTPFATFAINPIAGQASNQFLVGSSTATNFRVDNSGHVFMPNITQATGGTNQPACYINTTNEIIKETTTVCQVSSERFKHDITPINFSGLDLLSSLKPISYSPNDNQTFDFKDTQYGFTAEQVAGVDPHLAQYGTDDLPRTLDDRALLAVTVKAVQELSNKGLSTAKRSVEENWQWIAICLLVLWNFKLTLTLKKTK